MNNERTITIARRIAQAVERLDAIEASQAIFLNVAGRIPERSKRNERMTRTRIELLCHAINNA
jgi:hypothetical protein